MKAAGIIGTGTGKLGASVWVVRAGSNLVRAYQPVVFNPRTARQELTRTRLGFCSAIAKSVSGVLAVGMPTRGLRSPRNTFVKEIIPIDKGIITTQLGELICNYRKLILSKGGMPKPSVSRLATNTEAGSITVSMGLSYAEIVGENYHRKAGQPGLVLVVVNPGLGESVMRQVTDVETLDQTIAYPMGWSGMEAQVFMFGKWVLESGTTIASATTPWRYPSDQSDTVYCGEIRELL